MIPEEKDNNEEKDDDDQKHDYKLPSEVQRNPDDLRKMHWITARMARLYDTDLYLATAAQRTIIYMVFLAIVTICALGMVDPTMYFMTQGIRSQLKDISFKTDMRNIKFDEIRTSADFWSYMEEHFTKRMYTDGNPTEGTSNLTSNATKVAAPEDQGIINENKLIGMPVIRQVAVEKKTCGGPFAKAFKDCYPNFSKAVRLQQAMESYKYSTSADTGGVVFTGLVATYEAGGFFEKLGSTTATLKSKLDQLKNNKYITLHTRAVFVDMVIYNPNVNLFCSVKLLFEFPPTGGVLPSAYFHTLKFLRYSTPMDHIVLGCEVAYLIFIVYYLAEGIREIMFFKWGYFATFWNIFDVCIIVASLAYFATLLIQHFYLEERFSKVKKDVSAYTSFQFVTSTELMLRNMQAICLFLVYMKVFRFLSFNATMSILNHSLIKCAVDIMAFAFMLVIAFIAFALFGTIVFGSQIVDFMDFGVSMFTLLRTLLGDFNYRDLEKADEAMAPIFYMLFIFVVFFILLNLLLAIINDTYGDIKTEMMIGPPKMQLSDFWKRGFYNIMMDCGCGMCAPQALIQKSSENPTAEELRHALKRCGFSDLDIDMFLARYNIDPEAQVRVRDVSKLIESLRAEAPTSKTPPAQGTQQTPEKEKTAVQQPTVAIEDFQTQQDRLDKVEAAMGAIAEKLELLLIKLHYLSPKEDEQN